MKETSVDIGKVYALRSETGGEVTDENGKLLETLEPNVQLRTMAQEPKWLVPDDCKVTKGNFKRALAALFLLGEGKNILPSGYTRLEYLEGDGQAYLDIPREWKEADSFRLEYISTQDTPNETVYGAANAYRIVNGANYTRFMVAGKYYDFPKAVKGEKNVASIDAQKIIFNGAEKAIVAAEWTNDAANYKIFTNNTLHYKGYFRLLRFEHLSDTAMKLVPALDETGAPCMWDTVGRKAFYNVGTGDFGTPPSGARTYSLRGRRVLPDWGKLTENGLRRLYHAPANYKGELYDYALENGYKPIVEEPAPEIGYWVPVWHDREDCIELEWVETEPPVDEPLTIEA